MSAYQKDKKAIPLIILRHSIFAIIFHWIQVVLLSLAIITGLYMGNPFLGTAIPFKYVHYIHLMSNGILTGFILVRVYYSISTGDIRHFIPRRGDVKKSINLTAYYLFLRKEKPYDPGKYNVGQRIIYSSWFFGWLFQVTTGVILANESTLDFAAKYFGGLQTIRLIHYLIAVYFVITIMLHIYLSSTTNPAILQSIFTGYVRVKDGDAE